MEEQPNSQKEGNDRPMGAEPKSTINNDSRYLPRWKVKNRVRYALKDGSSGIEECETLDLSCTGACLKVSRPLLPGQDVKIQVYLDEENSVNVDGRVVWNRIHEGERHAGVVFHATSLEIQEMILNYAFEVTPDNVIKHWFSGWNKS